MDKIQESRKKFTDIKTILCIDLGTTTGWSSRLNDGLIISGSESFKPSRYEGGGMRYVRFRSWLTEFNQKVDGVEQIYFEEVRGRQPSVAADHSYGGFMATLTSWCEHHKIPYQGIPVGTIKKSICGKGNAGKQYVIDAVKAKGYNPKDDNEADALALLHCILTRPENMLGETIRMYMPL